MATTSKNWNTIHKTVSIILIICTFLVCCSLAAEEALPSLTLDVSEISVAKGRSVKVTATLANAKSKLIWEIEDPTIATVANGNITGKQNGTTKVLCSATLEDGQELSKATNLRVLGMSEAPCSILMA